MTIQNIEMGQSDALIRARRIAVDLGNFFFDQGSFSGGNPAALPASSSASQSMVNLPFAGISVRGVGYSPIDPYNTAIDEPNCIIYANSVSRDLKRSLPSEIEGVHVRVEAIGATAVRPDRSQSSTNAGNSYRVSGRIACGSSIAVAGEQSAGTLGALLRHENGDIYALSNNHVIGGCNHTPRNQGILSPSPIDVRPGGANVLQFAAFHSLIELRSGSIHHVPRQSIDAAIAKVLDPDLITSSQGGFSDTPSQVIAPMHGQRVKKVGRTTGVTYGTVEATIPLFELPYKATHYSATVHFGEVWSVRGDAGTPFGIPGDSGSLVVLEDDSAAVGLFFAVTGKGEIGFMSSLETVLSQFPGHQLLSGHNMT
jgi:hypothetical protein